MNEIDDILGTSTSNSQNKYSVNRSSNGSKTSNYIEKNRNDWKEKQNKIRQEIYDTMDKKAIEISKNPNMFKQYLDTQSKFHKHSVGNCLVILDKAPNSTQLKDKKSWNEKDIMLKENAVGIQILEPTKNNGRIYYNPKELFDISQTNAPVSEATINYGDRRLLEAIFNDCVIPRKAVDRLSDGTIGSEYNKDENVLYVCRGMDRELLFQSLYREIANIEMKDIPDSEIKSFRCYCISYMLCKRYGVDVSNLSFNDLPKEISFNSEGKAIRQELEKIRGNYEKINSRIMDYFDVSNKNKETEKKKSIPER